LDAYLSGSDGACVKRHSGEVGEGAARSRDQVNLSQCGAEAGGQQALRLNVAGGDRAALSGVLHVLMGVLMTLRDSMVLRHMLL